jgi:transposase InsO family protein
MICWWIYRSADIGWLKAAGLVLVRQMPGSAKGVMFAAPNDLWCADYKGEFRLGNHTYCYPLTVTDQASRFLLLCEARVPFASANALFNPMPNDSKNGASSIMAAQNTPSAICW